MKIHQRQIFQFILIFLMIAKLTNLQKKIYSNIHEKYSPLIFVYVFCFLATQQFYEIRKGVLVQIHASMLSHLTTKRVSKSDMLTAFSEKCLLQFIQDKKSLEDAIYW